MDEIIKARWVAALRSGEYKQATKIMRNGDSFCCLGVLCDLHSKETGTEWETCYGEEDIPTSKYLGWSKILPTTVKLWANLESTDPFVYVATRKEQPDENELLRLSTLNDQETSFKEIADLIEKEH